ncbi:MAG TPA: sulfur carrier protein ThiS adenylyltransferase ThiF [Bacteroidales bacterium]|nr:sulfur carrier protein ThiS adenylyltransferase ThiF [Bacteroidales bacterium]
MFNKIRKYLSTKVVGIAGCGGLGSNCAISLARVGIGKLIIADFDIVTEANLNRQYFFYDQIGEKKVYALYNNLLRVNPNVRVEPYDIKLDADNIIKIYSECDIIIEAFDLAEMKEMIIETVQNTFPSKPLISGIGIAGWGDNNSIRTFHYGNLYVCGDGFKEISDELPPLAPRVCIVANMQANQTLEILLADFK